MLRRFVTQELRIKEQSRVYQMVGHEELKKILSYSHTLLTAERLITILKLWSERESRLSIKITTC
jgi:hypothetical protein